EGERVRLHDVAVAIGEPDRLGLHDEVADGEDELALGAADHDTRAEALGTEDRCRVAVFARLGMQLHDRAIHRLQIKLQAELTRPELRRQLPILGGAHCTNAKEKLAGDPALIASWLCQAAVGPSRSRLAALEALLDSARHRGRRRGNQPLSAAAAV